MMTAQYSRSDLEAFAKEQIRADQFPEHHHTFRLYQCDHCGAESFELAIEHHTGSRKSDFRGEISGICQDCGIQNTLFSFTGRHRELIRTEIPVCSCGTQSFITGECERIEGDTGLKGFVDEGIVVGQCVECCQKKILVFTD